MSQQAMTMEISPKPAKSRPHVISITSGKGGVGKSNICANLAISMAMGHKNVLLVDADLSLGNLDVMLNINSTYNLSHMMTGRKNIEEIIHIGPKGVQILCGASGLEELANLNEFQRQRLLTELTRETLGNDILIIDTAAGISKGVASFCLASDQVILVTTPEATAMTDAYAMIKVLAKNEYHGRISVLVNMAETFAEGRKTYQQISQVASSFLNKNIFNAGVLLRDEKLRMAVRQRKPVVLAYPRAQISQSIKQLAAKLGQFQYSTTSENSFFAKMASWLI